MTTMRIKRILTIAGSDSGGGAGIQADLETFSILGCHGLTAITAVTAQNTTGVTDIQPITVGAIEAQMDSVLRDIGADGAKTGMLPDRDSVQCVARTLRAHGVPTVVVDPVLIATSGDALAVEGIEEALLQHLFPLASCITPNMDEAAAFAGILVKDVESMETAARAIHAHGARAVLVTGGHLDGEAIDVLFDGEELHRLRGPRLPGGPFHGAGCTFSAALTVYLVDGLPLAQAARQAKAYTARTLAAAGPLGAGAWPANRLACRQAYVAEVIETDVNRRAVIAALTQAVALLENQPLGWLVPEVRCNLAFALPDAGGPEHVAAFPGRLTAIDRYIVPVRPPRFGASRHIASVVLAAMERDTELRSAMNIRYSTPVLRGADSAGLVVAAFDRKHEPDMLKKREGSTLEWGTSYAMQHSEQRPDLVVDPGEHGKEPMVRVLGQTPQEVVEKVLRIARSVPTGGTR